MSNILLKGKYQWLMLKNRSLQLVMYTQNATQCSRTNIEILLDQQGYPLTIFLSTLQTGGVLHVRLISGIQIIFMDKQLSCLTRESDGREKAMDARRLQKLLCGRWSPENRGCRRQTPLLTQTPDSSKYGCWGPIIISPGRQTTNLFHSQRWTKIVQK